MARLSPKNVFLWGKKESGATLDKVLKCMGDLLLISLVSVAMWSSDVPHVLPSMCVRWTDICVPECKIQVPNYEATSSNLGLQMQRTCNKLKNLEKKQK